MNAIRDLIPAEYKDDYLQFKRKHHQMLNNIGINDHSLEEVLGAFHTSLSIVHTKTPASARKWKMLLIRCIPNHTDDDVLKHLLRHIT